MLYSNYKNKILKLSAVRDYILRHKLAFCALLCAIIALFATFLGFKGKIYKELDQQEIVVYGDNYRSGGGALFAFMGYEYRKLGTTEWVKGERPTAPGEYEVRGYALKGYGGKNYTEISTFTIEKRDVEIGVKQSEITYGDKLEVDCELASGDYVVQDKIRWNKSDIVNLNFSASVILSSVEIRNKKGENVTDYYNITCLKETVSVNKRVISIKVDGAEKEYDGTNLTCSNYKITSGSTVDGENLSLSFNDYIKDYGAVENKPDWAVYNSNGKNVSELYDVIFDCGYLSITKRKIVIKTGSLSKVYDGKPLYSTDFTIISEKGLVKGDKAVVDSVTNITFFGSCQNVLDINVYNGYERVTDNYEIEYDLGTLSIEKRNVLISSYSGVLNYNGQEQTYANFFVDSGSLADGDSAYAYNPASLKNVGKIENSLQIRVYHQSGEESTLSYDIAYTYGSLTITKRAVTIKPKDVNKPYDALPLETSEYEVRSGALASGHRAEIVTDGSITVVGSVNNYITSYEIYDYENNVVTDNYVVSTLNGVLTVNKRNVSIRPKSAQKTYDGTPLYATEFEVTTSVKLVEGHYFDFVTYAGSQTNVGTGISQITGWQIFDEKGVGVSDYYKVSLQKGSLTVLGRDLFIETGSASKTYDGTALESREFVVQKGLLDGDDCVVVDSSKVIDYVQGGYENKQTIAVYNALGEWVTNNYNIIYNYGTLTINKKQADVKLESVSKVYDALPLYVQSHTCSGLISGHDAVVDTDGFIVDAGSKSVSVKSITVYDQNGIDKTHNYDFNCYDATLTVTKRSIKIKPTDEIKEYDGTPLSSFDAKTIVDEGYLDLCAGHTVSIISDKSITEIGKITDNRIEEYKILDVDGSNVTENYIVSTSVGSLEVQTIKLTLSPLGWSKYYDGTAFVMTSDQIELSGQLLKGHELSFDIEISQEGLIKQGKYCGQYDLIIRNFSILVNGDSAPIDNSYQLGNSTVVFTDHYEVTLLQSLLIINKKKVYVSTESKSVVYDETVTDPNAVLVSAKIESVKVNFGTLSAWTESYIIPPFSNQITLYEYQEGVTKKINSFDIANLRFYGYENGERIDTTDNYEIISNFGTLTVKGN